MSDTDTMNEIRFIADRLAVLAEATDEIVDGSDPVLLDIQAELSDLSHKLKHLMWKVD